MDIKVERLTQEDRARRGIEGWPIWTKEVSRFPWVYDRTEECYILEGEVVVEASGGEKVRFEEGDFVTFPAGLSCTWDIKKPVKKHYCFS